MFCNMLERVPVHYSLPSTIRSGCGFEAQITMHVPFMISALVRLWHVLCLSILLHVWHTTVVSRSYMLMTVSVCAR